MGTSRGRTCKYRRGRQNLGVGVKVSREDRSECLEMEVKEKMKYKVKTMG